MFKRVQVVKSPLTRLVKWLVLSRSLDSYPDVHDEGIDKGNEDE